MKIIIAEDDPIRKHIAEAIRERLGIEVDEVGDGKSLVEKVRQGDYSLIFTDYSLPIKNGLTAIEKIRKDYPSIPICMISGSDVESKARKRGATDYLKKPITYDELKAVIEKHI